MYRPCNNDRKSRRVSFVGLDDEKEEEKSRRGSERRKDHQIIKRKKLKMSNEKKMKKAVLESFLQSASANNQDGENIRLLEMPDGQKIVYFVLAKAEMESLTQLLDSIDQWINKKSVVGLVTFWQGCFEESKHDDVIVKDEDEDSLLTDDDSDRGSSGGNTDKIRSVISGSSGDNRSKGSDEATCDSRTVAHRVLRAAPTARQNQEQSWWDSVPDIFKLF